MAELLEHCPRYFAFRSHREGLYLQHITIMRTVNLDVTVCKMTRPPIFVFSHIVYMLPIFVYFKQEFCNTYFILSTIRGNTHF